MPQTSRPSVVRARVPPQTRERFAALAAYHGVSEARLLARLIREVLQSPSGPPPGAHETDAAPAFETREAELPRVALRLRPGDRTLATQLAEACDMKLSSYLVLLVRNHVRRSVVPAPVELTQLKILCAHLASLRRRLEQFGTPQTTTPPAAELTAVLAELRRDVEATRAETAAFIRRNLIRWESGSED